MTTGKLVTNCWISLLKIGTHSNNLTIDNKNYNYALTANVSVDVMSDHIGRRDASHGGGCSRHQHTQANLDWL